MIKIALSGAALALALLAHAPAHAQAGGKKELVAKVLLLQQPGIEAMARQMAEQPAVQVMQQAGQALQRLAPERRDAADEAVPLVRDRAIKVAPTTIGPILEERFTEDELRQIVAMLESPTIRKFQGMAAEMQKALMEKVVADTRAEIEPKARAMTQSVSKRLAPPTAPATTGSAPKK
jgi:uncharacterized protein